MCGTDSGFNQLIRNAINEDKSPVIKNSDDVIFCPVNLTCVISCLIKSYKAILYCNRPISFILILMSLQYNELQFHWRFAESDMD